jgi:hypothetical protein
VVSSKAKFITINYKQFQSKFPKETIEEVKRVYGIKEVHRTQIKEALQEKL